MLYFHSRCDVCVVWTDEEMSSYLRHQESFKRKRESKEKERRLDSLYYVDLCIWGKGESGSAGVGESGLELPDDPIPAA